MYDKLVVKVNSIDAYRFVLKTNYGIDKSDWKRELVMQTKKLLILVDLLKNRLEL